MSSLSVSGERPAIASEGPENGSRAPVELADINAIVRSLAGRPLSEEVQEQLGRLQSIIYEYEPGTLGKDYLESLYVAAKALAAERPNVLLAQGILWDLEFYLIYSGGGAANFLATITGGWPMVTASIGMLCAVCLFVLFWLSFITLDYFKALPRFFGLGGLNSRLLYCSA